MGLLEVDPDSPRLDAVFRVLLLIYLFTIFPIVLLIGLIAGIIFMVIDVLLQLIRGDEGYNRFDNTLTNWLQSIFFWPLEQLKYIIGTDTTGFPILPQPPA